MNTQHPARMIEGAHDTRTVEQEGGAIVGRYQGGTATYQATRAADTVPEYQGGGAA